MLKNTPECHRECFLIFSKYKNWEIGVTFLQKCKKILKWVLKLGNKYSIIRLLRDAVSCKL